MGRDQSSLYATTDNKRLLVTRTGQRAGELDVKSDTVKTEATPLMRYEISR